jgi:hypothetical protein
MSSIEQLKRRVDSIAPAITKPGQSAWDKMSPDAKRADCRKWIKVWMDHHPEDLLTEEETEALITRLIQNEHGKTATEAAAGREAVARMSDAELEQRARQAIHRARETE